MKPQVKTSFIEQLNTYPLFSKVFCNAESILAKESLTMDTNIFRTFTIHLDLEFLLSGRCTSV